MTDEKRASVKFSPSRARGGGRSDTLIRTRDAVLDRLRKSIEPEASTGGRLKGKVGVITGVGPPNGIGTATARLMAREGATHLYLLDFVKEPLERLCSELQKTFPRTRFTHVLGDAASSKTVSSLVQRVQDEEQRLDFYFANAGVLHRSPTREEPDDLLAEVRQAEKGIEKIGDEEFMEVMRINVLSVFLAVKYAAPAMSKLCPDKGKTIPGGSIVSTASVAGLAASAGPIPYSASKAAVVSLAKTSASALTGCNVRVNAICPGLIETDMPKAIFEMAAAAGKQRGIGKLNPLWRQGLPLEVAHVACFLASDDSSYMNGQAVVVDGGLSSSLPFVAPKL